MMKHIFEHFDPAVMHIAMKVSIQCFNGSTEPLFGYRLPPYGLPSIAKQPRLVGFARGARNLAPALQPGAKAHVKTLTKFHSVLHQPTTKSDGFVQYQVNMGLGNYAPT